MEVAFWHVGCKIDIMNAIHKEVKQMTRTTFKLLTDLVKQMKLETTNQVLVHNLACRIGDTFKTSNPQFNKERFLKVCGF